MKSVLVIFLGWCLTLITFSYAIGQDTATYEASRYIPEVYDARVWTDDHLTTSGRWYKLLIVTDTLELKANLGHENPAVRKLIDAVSYYQATRYADAIRICSDILSYETDKLILLEAHFMLGTSIMKSNITDDAHYTARPHFESALQLALSGPEPLYEKAGKITCNMGHCMAFNTRYHDAAIACWRRSVAYLSKAGLQLPHPYYNMATHTLSREMVPIYLDSALAIIELDKENKPSPERAACLTFYGRYYWFHGQFGQSFQAVNEALEEYIAYYGEDHPSLIGAYLDIAWFCYYPNAPDLALLYSQKALDLALRYLDTDDDQIGNIYNVIGLCHMILGDHDLAIAYFNKRFGQNYKGEWAYFSMATRTWNNIALCQIKKGNFDEAIDLINKAVELSGKFLTPLKIDRYNTSELSRDMWFINLGQAYQQKGLYDQAVALYQIPLNIFIKEGGYCNTTVAGLYCEMALCYEKSGQPSKAIEYYSKALESMYCEIVNRVHLSEFMRGWTILFAQAGKARSHQRLWDLDENESDLDSAQHYYTKAVQQIDEMQKNFKKSGSRFRLSHILSEVQAIYEGAIAIALEKHQLTKKTEDLSDAFALAEKSKALLLLESVRGAYNYREKNEKWVHHENELKKDMARIRREIFKIAESDDPEDKKDITALNNELFDLWRDYEALIHQTDPAPDPSYFEIENVNVTNLEQTQEVLLQSGHAIIEYFEGYRHIYAFVVLPDTVYAVEILVDFALEQWVQDLNRGMYEYFVQRDYLDEDASYKLKTQYHEAAYGLYDKLIAPLGPLPEKLMIIPDGILGYIPFEVLLQRPVSNKIPAEEDFLIARNEISYNYSATLWQEMKHKEYSTSGLLAFAPEFYPSKASYVSVSEVRGEDLGPLLYNDDEVTAICRLVKGKAIYGAKATADQFRTMAEDYHILHLSTHAKLNDEDPDYSFLAFSGSEREASDDRLYISELYHMDLPVDMVVLSACETGTGKLQKGEGILSFARAFSSAGAKSVITSLWKANDKSTYEIMKSFYKYLKKGQDKSEALRSAKLKYLSTHKGDELHPFYWATFIPIGDMAAIEMQGRNRGWLWLLLPLLIIIISSIIFRQRLGVTPG